MAVDQEKYTELDFPVFLGLNTAMKPGGLAPGQFRALKNAIQGASIGAIKKRPGTIPVTGTPIGEIKHLTTYKANDKILATSGTSLYKYDSVTGEWVSLTGALNQADIYDVDFTDANTVSRKIIADKGALKAYDDATQTVSAITPAADDPSPGAPNVLSTLNGRGIKYVWTYSSHVFIAFEKSDEVWYSKRFYFDYFPSVQYERWVRNNDYVNGCGIAFDNAMLVPMRRNWGILLGSTFDNFQGNLFLNTTAGVIAPRSIAKIMYPNGAQTIAYLSDDGVHEIYDTGFEGEGSRRYSTRSLMKNKIDFDALGLTEAEKAAAVAFFDESSSLYILKFNKGSERIVYAYDTRNGEWYPWTNIKANGFVKVGDTLYYAGETGHLQKFDDELGSDCEDRDMTTKTPIDMDLYSDVIALEDTGYASYLDYLLIWAKQQASKSSIDVSINFFSGTEEYEHLVRNAYMIWGIANWGEAVWYNVNFTDLVGRPVRKPIKKKSYFFQIRMRNNRDEQVEIYRYKLLGRVSGA